MAPINSSGASSFRANTGYHLTARAIGNLRPFATAAQKAQLLDRFGNHLDPRESADAFGRAHIKLHHDVKVLTFNAMDNHLHNLAHQRSAGGIPTLMRRVMTGQAIAFNKETRWRGKVFSPFTATPFEESVDPTQIRDMVAYIELNNPITQFETRFAGFQVLIGELDCSWLDTDALLGAFGGIDGFREHMNRRGPSIVRRKLIEWGIDPRRHPYRKI